MAGPATSSARVQPSGSTAASPHRTALVNDWILTRPPTGVRQYLECLIAHWPTDASIELRGPRLDRRAAASASTTDDRAAPLVLRPLLDVLVAPRPAPPMERLLRAVQRRVTAAALRRRRGEHAVLFEPNGLVPGAMQPAVATMHDLSVLELPACHPPARVALWTAHARRAAEWTTRFICVSHATAAALHRVLDVPTDRIDVVHLASRWSGETGSIGTPLLPGGYLLAAGTLEPRKNHRRLLDAWATFDESFRRAHPLVFAGGPGWGGPEFRRALADHPLASSVQCTGSVSDDTLRRLVAHARGLLYPSLYEGFGLPPLEAMSLGVPVAVSTADALRETAADAALAIPADDTEGWAAAMRSLAEDDDERRRLIAAGRARAATFSWSTTARRHAEILDRVAREHA